MKLLLCCFCSDLKLKRGEREDALDLISDLMEHDKNNVFFT